MRSSTTRHAPRGQAGRPGPCVPSIRRSATNPRRPPRPQEARERENAPRPDATALDRGRIAPRHPAATPRAPMGDTINSGPPARRSSPAVGLGKSLQIRANGPLDYESPGGRRIGSTANEERLASYRLRRALERRDACRLGLASVCSLRDVRGDLRVRFGHATPRRVFIQRELANRLVGRAALAPLRKRASTPRGSTRLHIVRCEHLVQAAGDDRIHAKRPACAGLCGPAR